MEANQPTQEQIKEFWERHGLSLFDCPQIGLIWLNTDESIAYLSDKLPIDLNNLFEHAVPKLDQAQYYKCLSSIFLKQKDPALTLFWAIWGSMHGS